jgi:hypothetical protein
MGIYDLWVERADRLHFESFRVFYTLRSKAWDVDGTEMRIVPDAEIDAFYTSYLTAMRAAFCTHKEAILEFGSYRNALVELRALVELAFLMYVTGSGDAKRAGRLLGLLE